MCSSDLFLGLLALLFPPLPVWVKCGICSGDSLLNILLCMLGYVPGLLHAWYIIAKYPDPVDYHGNYNSEDGRVQYVRVNQGDEEAGGHGGRRAQQQGGQQLGPKPRSQPGRQANMSYGSAGGSSSSAPPPPALHDHNGGEGSSEDFPPPPSYAEVVGDHKIQDRS